MILFRLQRRVSSYIIQIISHSDDAHVFSLKKILKISKYRKDILKNNHHSALLMTVKVLQKNLMLILGKLVPSPFLLSSLLTEFELLPVHVAKEHSS